MPLFLFIFLMVIIKNVVKPQQELGDIQIIFVVVI